MTLEGQKRLEACSAEIAEILYRNSNSEGLDSLEGIEQTVRQQMLEEVSPRVAPFYQPTGLSGARTSPPTKEFGRHSRDSSKPSGAIGGEY